MLKYVVRRVLIFIPTLVAITLLGFAIMVSAPGDPVERMVVAAQNGGEIGSESVNRLEQKMYWSKKLGLDLPIFYISLTSLAQSDTLYRVYDRAERNALARLTTECGNWPAVSAYYLALGELARAHVAELDRLKNEGRPISDTLREFMTSSFNESTALRSAYHAEVIKSKIGMLIHYSEESGMVWAKPLVAKVQSAYASMNEQAATWRNYVPALRFYPNNQYHRWIFGDGNWLTGEGAQFTKGLVRADFGTSYTTKQPIAEVISGKFFWSFFFTMVSVILGYLVSIPLGVRSAVKKDTLFDRVSTLLLFILYSLPSFWVATLLLMTFANPDVLHWFPASGVEPVKGFNAEAGFFEVWSARLPYLILPMVAYSYSSFAFLSRTMRVSMLEIIGQDYIRTARAKGLGETAVIYKHALRNGLLPIITVFSNIFPIAIGGSVILEVIFTIPGMGSEVYGAIVNQNYPMVITVLTITGVLTLVGYLVSDILYAVVDPRISFNK